MEASEKPQLQFEGSAGATVRALNDRVVIEHLEVEDRRTAKLIRERAESGGQPAETIKDAIEIGARVLEREGLAADVDVARAELEQAAAGLREQFAERSRELTDKLERELERVFGGEGGALSKALDEHADELAEQVARHFDPERKTAIQNQVRELVGKSMQESRDALVRHLSSEDGSNPLADFKTGINRTVVEAVRQIKAEEHATREKLESLQQNVARLTAETEMAEHVAEAEAAGTRKGLGFEDRVHAAVERIAGSRGDAAHHTGGEASEGGGRKGDTVVEVGAGTGSCVARIVFEAKDKRVISKQEAWRQLNGALEERSADFAVLVVAGEDQIPKGREPLHEYEGNKLIVAVDRVEPDGLSLDVAYRLAVARVATIRSRSLSVDAGAVKDEAEAAVAALKEAQKVRRAMSGAKTSIDNARAGLDAMVNVVNGHLERIDSLVAEAEEEEEEEDLD